jgi:hypothetical protein
MKEHDYTSTFEDLYHHLDDLIEIAEGNLNGLKLRDDIDYARAMLSQIDELEKLKGVAGKLQERMEEIRDHELCISCGSDQRTSVKNGLRKVTIQITEGMLRQSLLSMTAAKKAGVVKLGEQFKIHLPSGEELATELINPGNKLRERGRIQAFYKAKGVKEGDYVVLTEFEKGVWKMGVIRSAEMRTEDMKNYGLFQ